MISFTNKLFNRLTDTDEDVPEVDNSMTMMMTSKTVSLKQTSTTSVTNNFAKSSFKAATRTSSFLPPEEEIVVLDSDGEDSIETRDTTDIKNLFNLVNEFVSKPISSSPVKLPSESNNSILNDSIVDSTFNFLIDGIIPPKKAAPPPPRPPSRAPAPRQLNSTDIPANILWLDSDEDEDDGPIIPSSQPAPQAPVVAQPVKRSKSTQEPSTSVPAKRTKRPKTTDPVTHLPRIDDFQYTHKDLNEANRATRKKEEIFEEMELHMSSGVYEFFSETKEDFKLKIFDGRYDLPLVLWKRNVKAMYDKERDLFIPCHPRKLLEKTFVMYYLAPDFLMKLKKGELKSDVAAALNHALAITPNEYHIIIMVEGYDQQVNKIKAYEQRKFKKQVLHGLNTQEQARTRTANLEMAEYPSSADIEILINKAQIELGTNIFTVRGRSESVMWLNTFTNMIGHSLYDKFERNTSVANLGTVRSGADAKATFMQSMQQFKLMTQSKADILYTLHQSIYLIYCAFRDKGTLGRDRLGRNIVPPTVDKSMMRLFTANDPNSVIS